MIDKNEFFREITVRICGNLNIEKALHACITSISSQIPADRMYLERFDRGTMAMHLVARADLQAGQAMDQLVTLDKSAMEALKKAGAAWKEGKMPPVIVINRSEEEPVTRCMLKALGEPESSVMSMPLHFDDQMLGTIVLMAEGCDRYTAEHADLFSLVKEPFGVALSNTLKHMEVIKLKDLLKDDNRYLQEQLMQKSGDDIIGSNFGLKTVMTMVRQVADMDSPVVLLGETGTGKDVIANAIHNLSSRKDQPFISVNCGAIPESLIDSELFGHEKGAFTGALSRKRGRFERANNGTIFLDEIGELPLNAQVRLLRVLQNREIERIGGTEQIKLNIRIIAATNRNLEEMVQNNQFREDLWFRLNVFPIEIPPLRERTSDIPSLVQHFIQKKAKELKLKAIPELAPGTIDKLNSYGFPGNVRELENLIERELILNNSGPLSFDNLPGSRQDQKQLRDGMTLDEAMKTHIQNALQKCNGKLHGKNGAAELLNINPNTLRNRMQKLGIDL